MARVLIVGCGCRGRALAAALIAEGHVVRGTTRRESALSEIDETGTEAVLADPDRLGTLLPQLGDVSVICWLMGSVLSEGLHGPRLRSLVERIVDTPVRGFVYEAAGAAGAELLERGASLVRAAGETYRIPIQLIEEDPGDHEAWLASSHSAVSHVLWHPSPPEVGTWPAPGGGRPKETKGGSS